MTVNSKSFFKITYLIKWKDTLKSLIISNVSVEQLKSIYAQAPTKQDKD